MDRVNLSHKRGWLDRPAAESLAKLDKIKGSPVDVNSAGRTYAEQKKLWDLYYYPNGAVRPASQRPSWLFFPAKPGTSIHEKGRSIDTNDIAWLEKHGRDYGWVRELPKSDPVHFNYYPARDKHLSKAPAKKKDPLVTVKLIGTIGEVRGLQKMLRPWGYTGKIDNLWGPGSQTAMKKFLSAKYKGSVAHWLRSRWGYVGDDRLGPKMKEALRRVNSANDKVF